MFSVETVQAWKRSSGETEARGEKQAWTGGTQEGTNETEEMA